MVSQYPETYPPHDTHEESGCLDDILNTIEVEILPKVLDELNIPIYDTDLRTREYRERRRSERYRRDASIFESIKHKRLIFRHLRNNYPNAWNANNLSSMGEGNGGDTQIPHHVKTFGRTPDSDSGTSSNNGNGKVQRTDPSSLSGEGISELKPSVDSIQEPDIQGAEENDVVTPFKDPFPKTDHVSSFKADPRIRNRRIQDSLFDELLSSVRDGLLDRMRPFGDIIIEGSPLSSRFMFRVTLEKDVEVPSWDTINIKAIIPEVSFEWKMKIWDWLDDVVRAEIQEMRNEYIDNPTKRRRIEEMNKNIFIDISL